MLSADLQRLRGDWDKASQFRGWNADPNATACKPSAVASYRWDQLNMTLANAWQSLGDHGVLQGVQRASEWCKLRQTFVEARLIGHDSLT